MIKGYSTTRRNSTRQVHYNYYSFGGNTMLIITILVSISSIALALSPALMEPVEVSAPVSGDGGSQQISISMPDVRPDHAEQYLCIAHRLPADWNGQYIVGFNPKANANRVHHMLLYACQLPGVFQRDTPNFVWDCGEMHSSNTANQEKSFNEGTVCQGKQQLLYGWALDAPSLKLPKAVGFKVGGWETDLQTLVLQVHYGHFHAFQQQPDLTDNSGLILDMKHNDPVSGITRQAGILLLISAGRVATGKTRHEIWCDINEDIEIHPFRYRVHTHKLGTRVLGAKLGNSGKVGVHKSVMKYGSAKDDMIIGVGDPQQPQMFYPVKEKDVVIRKGDTVYAYCEFNNNKTHSVSIGPSGDDEMCNFYLMYWTDSPKLLSKGYCFGMNPPAVSPLSSLW